MSSFPSHNTADGCTWRWPPLTPFTLTHFASRIPGIDRGCILHATGSFPVLAACLVLEQPVEESLCLVAAHLCLFFLVVRSGPSLRPATTAPDARSPPEPACLLFLLPLLCRPLPTILQKERQPNSGHDNECPSFVTSRLPTPRSTGMHAS